MKGWRNWRIWLAAGVVLAVAGGTFALLAPRSHQPPSLPRTATSAAPKVSVSPLVVPPKVAGAIPRSIPVKLSIPAIGVNGASVVPVYDPGGTLQTPPLSGAAASEVGWWAGLCGSQDTGTCSGSADPQASFAPGQDGPAVLVAHVNSAAMGNLTFANLDQMKAGEAAQVTLADGASVWFTVYATQEVSKTAFPTSEVYGPTQGPELRLITCGGAFDSATGHYVDNFIVYLKESVASG